MIWKCDVELNEQIAFLTIEWIREAFGCDAFREVAAVVEIGISKSFN